jgi:endo-1,4-beta-D-glucanase Y
MTDRRFPPPWTIEELNDACFVVRDANEQQIAYVYVYFEEEPGRRTAAKLLTRDEARRIAANIAKLPELVPLTWRCTLCEARERLRPHGP